MSLKSFSQDVESLSKDIATLSEGIKNFNDGFADGFVQGSQEVIKWYDTAFASISDLFKNSIQSVQQVHLPELTENAVYNADPF